MKKAVILTAVLVFVSILTGCTNWEQKYRALDVEHQNLKGLYEGCISSLDGMSIKERDLQSQLTNLRNTSATDTSTEPKTGFEGVGDVKYDAGRGTITVTLSNAILFSPGKATLMRSTSAELDQIMSVINQRYSGNQVDVVGHTDSDPIKKTAKLWKDNWELSAERALTVLRYMQGKGIRPERIRGVACGESRPVASNSTANGKARNRRVEIVVHTQ